MKPRRLAPVVIAAASAAALFWAYTSHSRSRTASPEAVPIQDGKTLDFSGGSPVVAETAADKAALAAGVKAIDEATKNVTFAGVPPEKK